MKKLHTLLLTLGIMAIANQAMAANLLEVFHQAQSADPVYQEAKATYLSARSQLGQTRSYLLPNLNLTGSWKSTVTDGAPGGNAINPTVNGANVTLSLTQVLFDWSKFKAYSETKLTIKAAAATYAVAAEMLITRTANAYFTVLKDEDLLRFAAANKRQLYRSYQVADQRYKVGLDAIAAVYDAKASYDGAKATYIASENTLANDKEALREITGQLYPSLSRLKENFPLVNPQPENIDAWTKAAIEQNLSLLSARYTTQAAREDIKVKSGQHAPTLGLLANYDYVNMQPPGDNNPPTSRTEVAGVQLKVPLYAGGLYSAQTRTAEYDYQTAVAQMDSTYRSTVASVRNNYLSVIAGISKILADRQAIKSAKASLASYEAGYKVGTQTIVEVLQAQSTLYQNEQTYASDRFNYVIDTFNLKKAAGILSVNDLIEVNNWLTNKAFVDSNDISRKTIRRDRLARHRTAAQKKPQVHRTNVKATRNHNKTVTQKTAAGSQQKK